MRAVVDTQVLIWAAAAPENLSRRVSEAISAPENELLVSAASAWEIATKVRLGKLPSAVALEVDFLQRVGEAGYTLIGIDVETALLAGRLIGEHRDPFDRMIAAHALRENIPVLSSDPKLDAFGIRRIW